MKRFLLIWKAEDGNVRSEGYDDLPACNRAIEYLLEAGLKPVMYQRLRDYK